MTSQTVSPSRVGVAGTSVGLIFRGTALLAVFWVLAGDYLFVYFSSDDFMNLYRAVGQGWGLARGLVLFWSSQFLRPLGGVVYLGLYTAFGFDPLAFKLVMLLVLTANLLIAWRIASLLLGNSRLGALAALLVLYHASVAGDIVYNFGNFATIYDIVCFTCMYTAFWIWLEARRGGRLPGKWVILLIAALQILALDSKEMAVALPVLFLLRELFCGGLVSRDRPRVAWRALPAIGLLTLITAVFIAGKSRGAESLLSIADYHPTFTLDFYLQNMSRYLNQLFYTRAFFQPGWTACFLCGGLAIAALLRARVMALGWLWLTIGLLPVAFIPGRSGSVLYIPSLGLAVGVVDLLQNLFQAAAKRIPASGRRYLDPAGSPAFLMALVCLTPLYAQVKQTGDAAGKQMAREFRSFAKDLSRAANFRPAASLLYLRDPFDAGRYDPLYLSSLLRGDHGLRVGRVKRNQVLLSPKVIEAYDEVYDFENGHLHRIAAADLAEVAGGLRAASGYADPDLGIKLNTDSWWWAQQDFGVTAHCPAAQTDCRLTVELRAPVPPFSVGDSRNISIDLAGVRWRDFSLAARSDPYQIDIPLPAGRVTQVRFHVDRAIPTVPPNGGTQELAIVVSRIQIR